MLVGNARIGAMRIEYLKGGEVVHEEDVNTDDPAVAKGAAIVGRAQLGDKADAWRIVNELGRTIKKSEN
jgi:hypothetical protein